MVVVVVIGMVGVVVAGIEQFANHGAIHLSKEALNS